MFRNRLLIRSSLLLIIVVLIPIKVLADSNGETVFDLFQLYNVDVTSEDAIKLDDSIADIQESIASREKMAEQNRTYNIILQAYNNNLKIKMSDVYDNIVILDNKNVKLNSIIANSIWDASPSELISYDSEYKSNQSRIIEYEDYINSIKFSDSFKNENIDVTELLNKLRIERELLVEAEDYYILGNVNNIFNCYGTNYGKRFGYNYSRDNGLVFSSGVEFLMDENKEVPALFNGEVLFVGKSDTMGNFVTLSSGDSVTHLYCHLNKVSVYQGQKVSQYETIGLAGNTGSECTDNCVHIFLFLKGNSVDVCKLFE